MTSEHNAGIDQAGSGVYVPPPARTSSPSKLDDLVDPLTGLEAIVDHDGVNPGTAAGDLEGQVGIRRRPSAR